MSERNENGLALFLAGLAIGAIAGVLLAPESGQETRRRIAETARSLKDKAQEEFHQGIEHLKTDVPRASHRYNEAMRSGWKAFLDALEKDKGASEAEG